MNKFVKIAGAAAVAGLLFSPVAFARDGHGGGGFGGGGGAKFSGGGGGAHFNGGARFSGGGGGPKFSTQNFSARQFSGRPSGNFNGPRIRHNGNNFANYGGGKHHGHRGHWRGGRFIAFGSPFYYDNYYYDDYAYGNSCSYYWNRYQATGNPKWKYRYYDCIG